MKEEQKKERKIFTKNECINEAASVESMKKTEKKLWLTHYNQLCVELLEVLREKCTGCQAYETNYIEHERCALLSAEEEVNQCFEVYA